MSKNPMGTFDKVLESSNIIFFDSKILGTTWEIYVHMKIGKILKIRKISMYFYDILGTQNKI